MIGYRVGRAHAELYRLLAGGTSDAVDESTHASYVGRMALLTGPAVDAAW